MFGTDLQIDRHVSSDSWLLPPTHVDGLVGGEGGRVCPTLARRSVLGFSPTLNHRDLNLFGAY